MGDTTESPVAEPATGIDAAIERRKAEWAKESKTKPAAKPAAESTEQPSTEAGSSGGSEQRDGAHVSGEKASGKDQPTAKQESVQQRASDLSWLPDKFRTHQSRQSPEFLEYVKEGFLRDGDYRKKTQEIAAEREKVKADKEDAETWRLLKKNPQAADVAYRMTRGETLEDIIASMHASQAEAFSYHGADDPDIDKRVETIAESVLKRTEKAKSQEVQLSEKTRAQVQDILVSYIKDNAIDGETGFAAIQSAGAALSEDGLTWTTENAERVLKRHLALVKATGNGKATGTNGKAHAEESGLSKVASPAGRGVGTEAVPIVISKEVGKRWADGSITDEERVRIFNRIKPSRRGSDEPTAREA